MHIPRNDLTSAILVVRGKPLTWLGLAWIQTKFPMSVPLRFKTVIRLQTHCRLLHKNRRFNCTQCDKSFHYKRHLEYHLERHAGKVPAKPKPFVCNVCGKGFVSNSVLAVRVFYHVFSYTK